MNPSILQSLTGNVAKLGADILFKHSRAVPEPPPAATPSPKVFGSLELVEDAASAAFVRLKTMGIPESEALKAVIREEADRRIHERLNDVYEAAWDQASREKPPPATPDWLPGVVGFGVGVATTVLIFSLATSRSPRD